MRRSAALAVMVAFAVSVSGCGSSGEPARTAAGGSPSPSPSTAVDGQGRLSAQTSPSASAPAGCTIFPADNVWHADVSRLPVHRDSAAWVASIGASAHAHPDFGAGLIDGAPFGIPVTTLGAGQAGVKVTFEYADESDKGPYPIPRTARVEGGPNADGDRHVIVHDTAACKAYELYDAHPDGDGSWRAGSGAVFDLRRNDLRRAGWTSADAAGLSVLAGLPRAEEVAAGRIDHAIRFTAPRTRKAYVWPARHAASSSTDAALPPMGARFRLKASVDISKFPAQARVVAQALKQYGAILADNGSPWYFSGTQDDRWNNGQLNALKGLTGTDFEAVDGSLLMVDANSARCRQP
ncbi:hypothetical protein Daura_26800 [Dactylosporangium aurantiacum]|uniref:Lipoprotein n=1 Tax=Dactylosporangium aurantiacum TaxID=35754 RepID=A0A9Q9IC09_9ACTN|nr:hypothetical protein [Dactylosporangium aurantiacum]MDG6106527.1 hypothetical protein [Dactylosporangium aurantiacum]UWZ50443.1 hypothetical protein Daura_26800 [Dactylosporangium aurantiacum]